MSPGLINGHGITKMTGRATDHPGIMGRIQLFFLVTEEAHIDAAAGGHIDPISVLRPDLTENKQNNRHHDQKQSKLLP
jgi:hypothetical protein